MSEKTYKIETEQGLVLSFEDGIGESKVRLINSTGEELISALIILDEFHGRGCIESVLNLKSGDRENV